MKPINGIIVNCLFFASSLCYAVPSQHDTGVSVQLFGWRWSDIAQECQFLHQAGYTAVKIDPPNEYAVVLGSPWWASYQPVSYQLNKQQGGAETFKAMTAACHQNHIKIIADVVLNHMANANYYLVQQYGINGTAFGQYDYHHLFEDKNIHFGYAQFHHLSYSSSGNCIVRSDDIQHNRNHVLNCDLLGLPDLDQNSPIVFFVQRNYLQNLLKLGVDGFRIDAAMYMPTRYLHRLFKNLKTNSGARPFLMQEVTGFNNDAVKPKEYYRNGLVTNFAYRSLLREVFSLTPSLTLKSLVQQLKSSSEFKRIFPSKYALVFVNNQDTEQQKNDNFAYIKSNAPEYGQWIFAYAFLLSWPYGVPQVYSGYRFYTDNSPYPNQPVWQNGKASCFQNNSPWLCQHRLPIMLALVNFYNHMQHMHADKVCRLWAAHDQLAFARCNGKGRVFGYVVMNHANQPFHFSRVTGLPAGRYMVISYQDHQYHKMVIRLEAGGRLNVTLPASSFMIIK